MQLIEVEIALKDGQRYSSVLQSDSPILRDLFVSLATNVRTAGTAPEIMLQFPIEDGHAACSFMSNALVSVTTKPPVLIQPEQQADPQVYAQNAEVADSYVKIEDFLTPAENDKLLKYALRNEAGFEGSSVLGEEGSEQDGNYRKSKVLFSVKDTDWKETFVNRLKPHLAHIMSSLSIPDFPHSETEIQLTASNDGDFFKAHADSDHTKQEVANRVLTFVYYFHKIPKPYFGGDLLLYQNALDAHGKHSSSQVTAIAPENNYLIAFASDRLHEVDLIQCPTRAFADSRFTINGWMRSGSA